VLKYFSDYARNAYTNRSAYSCPVQCETCPGTESIQTIWDLLPTNSRFVFDNESVLPDYVSFEIQLVASETGTTYGTWTLDVGAMTVTAAIINQEAEYDTTVTSITTACLPLCRETFAYWYGLIE
jgi:hypothetical protein